MGKEIFLVSSPFVGQGLPFNKQNKFLERYQESLSECKSVLFITSDPDNVDFTEEFSKAIWYTMKYSDINIFEYNILDGRNSNEARQFVLKSDAIILAGGHVPTQNRFFQSIRLRDLLKEYNGVVLGISAGSMNSADIVYAQPEEEGEGNNPHFEKFLAGLGLTKHMILPHYQNIKNQILDGKRLFEDITYSDSMGKEFYALTDGSYLYIKDEQERICGEAYLIKDGVCKQICADGEEKEL